MNEATEEQDRHKGWIAAGGIMGAILASTCCLLPLVLTVLGISGAWMANLRALEAYQPYFLAATAAFLGYGFYLVYWKAQYPCTPGDACARTAPNRLVKIVIWSATIIVIATLSFTVWFPLIAPYLP